MSEIIPRSTTVKTIPKLSGLMAETDQTVDFLVKIQGPDRPPHQADRAPLNLALVIDRSGSMGGQPLHEAKRCARAFISRLRNEDHVALVAYDNRAQTLFDSQPIGNRAALYEAINAIRPGGSTNLHMGWITGCTAIRENRDKATISRVLLLSDGQANQGITETESLSEECAHAVAEGISTSTYGLSHHFNEDLMTSMAKQGQGQAYYGETAEDLMEPFQQEFDLLSSIYARKVRLSGFLHKGLKMEVLNSYLGNEQTILPDLAYEAEVWVLIRIQVPAALSGKGHGELIEFGELHISGIDLEGNALSVLPIQLGLPSLNMNAYQSLTEEPEVRRRLIEIESSQLQEQARVAAQHGQWDLVDRILEDVKALAKDNPWLDAVVVTLKDMARRRDERQFSKEARYSSFYLSTRYSGRDESVTFDADPLESLTFTRRKSRQGKNSDGSSE